MDVEDFAGRLATRSIHGGLNPEPETGAILTPVYQTATFVQEEVGKDRGYTYSRSGNPTIAALERNLGAVEGCGPAIAFATGLAAETALLLATCRSGDHVVCSNVVYGGTVRLLRQILAPLGVSSTLVDTSDLEAVATALQPSTRLVFVETPANPTLLLTDIAAVAEQAHEHGALVAVDNTFLTPALQRPFELGADVVVYSTTKFIEGHNATIGGALLAKDDAMVEKLRFVCNAVGSTQAPWDGWLTLRGLKTLPLRMREHSRAALAVARYLESHPSVASVRYPGLASFPQRELAVRQHRDHGGIIAFELRGGIEAARLMMARVKICSLAESLGAVETLITHPATMTHAPIPPDERRAAGISDGLVRLSVGLEDTRDICADLDEALGTLKRGAA